MNITVIPPVTETRVVEVAPAKVQLELSLEEVSFITAVLGRVAESLDKSVSHLLYSQLYNKIICRDAELLKRHRGLTTGLTGIISFRRQ